MIEELLNLFSWIIYIIGFFTLLKIISILYRQFKAMSTKLNSSWASKYGLKSWAVVTGCTQGIGKAFCFELAELQFNLVLICRSQQKLQRLSQELLKLYPNLDIIIVVADFSEFSQTMYEKIYNKINHIDISILVNNVGYSPIKQFHAHTQKDIEDLININIKSMTHLTSKIIPKMLQRKQRSAIINLSSSSIYCPFKNLSVYTATKSYNDLFSRCLAVEYNQKIDILSSRPGIVSTAAINYTKDNACSAKQCVVGTLKALGNSMVTEGYFGHFIESLIVKIIGERGARYLGELVIQKLQKLKE